MLAILGGLGAAICWATSSLASARSARRIGPWSTLGWVMLLGMIFVIPATILTGAGADFTPTAILLLFISGVTNVVGLLLAYTAFRGGKVAVVAPILSTEGAMGAVIAVLFGERVAIAAAVVLAVVAVGVILASSEGTTPDGTSGLPEPVHPDIVDRSVAPAAEGPIGALSGRTTLIAVAAAICFGINLYASARIGSTLPLVWSILPARLAGVIGVAIPLILVRRLRLTRAALPFIIVVAIAEIVGTAVYAFGARDGIAVAAVISSQFGAMAAVVSVLLFRERIRRIQVIGVVTIAVGVAVLAGVRAT